MNRTKTLRQRFRHLFLVTSILASSLLLTSCFLFENPSLAYGVNLSYYDPKLVLEPYCFGVDLKATFGTSLLLDVSVDQTDLFANSQGIEGATSGIQRYYAGMPLTVQATCRNELGDAIGQSLYEGKLIDPRADAYFTLWNYPDPDIDLSKCIPATAGSGVQMCATGYGFRFE